MPDSPRFTPNSITTRCVLFGFIAAFALGFVYPVFLNPEEAMAFFRYILSMHKIGMDLRAILAFCRSWAINGNSPYIEVWVINPYPPFMTLFFSPLAWLSFTHAYLVMTLLTLSSYLLSCTLLLRKMVGDGKDLSLAYLFLGVGLFSYGLHFELERGQFNLMAMTFVLASLALWQDKGRLHTKIASYILLSIGIQLKVYPAIFALCLTDNLKDWKHNVPRLFLLGLANFLMLFILGIDAVKDFFHYLTQATATGKWLWVGAHSIQSFSKISGYAGWPYQLILAVCFVTILIICFIKNKSGKTPLLLLSCCCVALLVPAVSHDYKLSILHPFVCLTIVILANESNPVRYLRIMEYFIITFVSFAYFLTNYSYTNKAIWNFENDGFRNNMPLILCILIGSVSLMVIRELGLYRMSRISPPITAPVSSHTPLP